MRCALLTGLMAVALGAASAAPAVAARCPTGGVTVASDGAARVYRVHSAQTGFRHYGCASAVGRPIALDSGDRSVDFPLVLRGATVAYQTASADLKPYRIVVRGLRTGRILGSANANHRGSADGVAGPALRLLLGRDGAAAWTATADCVCEGFDSPDDTIEVHVLRRGGRHRLVARSDDIDPKSLRLTDRGRAVTWLDGAQRRRARLG